MAQDDGDELLRLLILAVLATGVRPMDAEELAERVAAMIGTPGSGRMATLVARPAPLPRQ